MIDFNKEEGSLFIISISLLLTILSSLTYDYILDCHEANTDNIVCRGSYLDRMDC